MRSLGVSFWIFLFCLSLTACGGSDSKDPSVSTESVGDYGGDCEDGDTQCTDEFGAELCPSDPSGYPGDTLALCDPGDVSKGMLLHYGPENYDDPDEMAKYTMPAFSEEENCVFVRTPNTETVFINGYHGRMRPNSHHLILTFSDADPDTVELGVPTACNQGELLGNRWLVGSQDPQIDVTVEGNGFGAEPAKEGDPEYGVALRVPPNSLIQIDLHYLNTTDQEILREAWMVLETVPEEEVVKEADMITFYQAAISIPAHETGVKTAVARCKAPTDRYVHLVTGHFHEFGTRFSVWYEAAGKTPEMVYDTVDWDVPGNAFFTDRINNPDLSGIDDGERWGAESGYLFVKAGDYINFQCEFDNPSDQTVTFGETGADQMCNVFGLYYPTTGNVWNCACVGALCTEL